MRALRMRNHADHSGGSRSQRAVSASRLPYEKGMPPLTVRLSSEELLEKLVGFNTVSRNSNLDLIHFVRDHLSAQGIASTLVPSPDATKSSLFATIGPSAPGGIVLSGHTDVVPANGDDWQSDPFVLTRRDDRLYGRGTTDMKGFLAASLAMVPEMIGADLKRPIHLAFSYDEEIGCLGAPPMIERMVETIPMPAAVIVGEPTDMAVVTGHKGVLKMTTRLRGKSVHSSVAHLGVSAIAYAARLAVWLDERMRANARLAKDERFDPPYTTLHSGMIEGGSAFNITATDATLVSDIRAIPGEVAGDYLEEYAAFAKSLETEMRAVDPACGISIEVECDVPGCRAEENGAAETLARSLTGDNGDHVVAYGTEAGQFQDAGLSAVVCGPGNMKRGNGHDADEFIEISQLRAGEAFQRRLIESLAA